MIIKNLKLMIKLLIRIMYDRLQGNNNRFAMKSLCTKQENYSISLFQEIKLIQSYKNKIINLRVASDKIKQVSIKPNQIFSFWNIVGKPNETNGFKKGRNIINGALTEDYGGGLCQLSSILYHLCLISKLNVIERHNHSIDLYNKETRFTPLGADATIVYGYKDLRFINNFDFTIYFDFEITQNKIKAILISERLITQREINFTKKDTPSTIYVTTTNKEGKIMATSHYKKPMEKKETNTNEVNYSFTSILTSFLVPLFILGGIFYFLFTGLFDFIIYSFSQDIISFLIGLGLVIVIFLFSVGSILNIKEGYLKIKLRRNSKKIKEISFNPFYKALLLGSLPLLLSVIFGMIDFYIYKINEILLVPILLVVFSPFLFAKKLKSSILEIFYGTLFWFLLFIIGFYILN